MPQSTSESVDALAMTGEIVSAFVANNSLPLAELPARRCHVDTCYLSIAVAAPRPT